MPFKDTKEGQTHSYNDGCGDPEHNTCACGLAWEHTGKHAPLPEIKTTIQNIGMMRQWLNEDRITEPSKMVTNEDILHWLRWDFK